MTTRDPTGPAPETREPRFLWLLFGACAAPLFWLGQMMLGYGVTAYVCYPGDHPVSLDSTGPLFAVLVVFDIIALAACAAGGWVSLSHWRRVRSGRNRFLALWGLISSLWFSAAILFNAIASIAVPPCLS
jgi:hypothetical protein